MARRRRAAAEGAARRRRSRACLRPISRRSGPSTPNGRPFPYPGSPAIAQDLLRAQRPPRAVRGAPGGARASDHRARARFAGCSISGADGYAALNAYVPPKERRGLVLIDPPLRGDGRGRRRSRPRSAALCEMAARRLRALAPDQGRARRRAFPQLAQGARRPEHAAPRDRRRRRRARPACARALHRTGLILVNPPFGLIDEARVADAVADEAFDPRGQGRLRLRLADGADLKDFAWPGRGNGLHVNKIGDAKMSLPKALQGKLRLPVIGAPLFIISHPASGDRAVQGGNRRLVSRRSTRARSASSTNGCTRSPRLSPRMTARIPKAPPRRSRSTRSCTSPTPGSMRT